VPIAESKLLQAVSFFRLNETFTMAIKALAFDAYGTLYDVQSVSQITEQEFPANGNLITQVWRLKQLEYTWLRTLMGKYRSFWEISEESLVFTLRAIGLEYDDAKIARIMDKYLHLDPYPDCLATLDALQGRPLSILSNGNQEILDALVKNTGVAEKLTNVISIDSVQQFKPNESAYKLVEKYLNVVPKDTLFVSSNAFDACAAKNFGFQVAWIERVTPSALAEEIKASSVVGPLTIFKMLRMQMENFDLEPDYRLTSLSELPKLVLG